VKPLFVQWGAGNIGRSFIGQVFSRNGYRVVFIDIDEKLVETLNIHKRYVVETVSRDGAERLQVDSVCALHVGHTAEIADAIAEADLMGVSVGKNAWPSIAPQLARAIAHRHTKYPDNPIDIILAENIHNAAAFTASLLSSHLPKGFPLDSYVGLIEASIGKMVPIQKASTPLLLRSEPYNELLVDKRGFRNPIPNLKDLHPVEPMQAYMDRKLFIHNLGHAACAYLGYLAHPDQPLIAQVLEDPKVFTHVRKTMLQSMEVLLHLYPDVFTRQALERHIDDLLLRFGNRALGDTVFRVGRDLKRKLHFDDRIMGIIIQAQRIGLAWDRIGHVYLAALSFTAGDTDGKQLLADQVFLKELGNLKRTEMICHAAGWKDSDLPEDLCRTISQAFDLIGQ